MVSIFFLLIFVVAHFECDGAQEGKGCAYARRVCAVTLVAVDTFANDFAVDVSVIFFVRAALI